MSPDPTTRPHRPLANPTARKPARARPRTGACTGIGSAAGNAGPEVVQDITAAFALRARLEAAGASRQACMRPMWWLTARLCASVPRLARQSGELALRLGDLPSTATPAHVWDRIRTAHRADDWDYSPEHHHAYRIADFTIWPRR
jgi:hypothetical protein